MATLETELENAKLSEGNLEQMQLAINRLEEVEARCTSLVAQVQHANASLDHLSGLFTTFYTRLRTDVEASFPPTPQHSLEGTAGDILEVALELWEEMALITIAYRELQAQPVPGNLPHRVSEGIHTLRTWIEHAQERYQAMRGQRDSSRAQVRGLQATLTAQAEQIGRLTSGADQTSSPGTSGL